jgi:hypothetical protein
MKGTQTLDLKVIIRLKPKVRELKKNYIKVSQMNLFKQITLGDPFHGETGDVRMFLFDNVFKENMSQFGIFEEIGTGLLNHLMKGNNAAVFCYGNSSNL